MTYCIPGYISVDVALGSARVGVSHGFLHGGDVAGACLLLEPAHGMSAECVAAAVIGPEVDAYLAAGGWVDASLACRRPAMVAVLAHTRLAGMTGVIPL